MAHQPLLKLLMQTVRFRFLFVSGIVFAAALGMVGNMLNWSIAEEYTAQQMSEIGRSYLFRAVIAKGLRWGIVWGVLFSTVLTAAMGCISRVRCPLGMGVKTQLGVAGNAAICWLAGGSVAVGLAVLSPEYFMVHSELEDGFGPMLREAWASGSLWGLLLGGAASVVIGSVAFKAKWDAFADSKDSIEPKSNQT